VDVTALGASSGVGVTPMAAIGAVVRALTSVDPVLSGRDRLRPRSTGPRASGALQRPEAGDDSGD
jgi:hypothetical protein